MNAIEEAINRLKLMAKKADQLAVDIVESNPVLLGNLNRGQLREGVNSVGSDMPSYVSNSKAPKAPGTIKLFNKGEYTKGINPLFSNEGIDMTSKDQKVKFLDPKYPLALGLNDDSVLVIQKEIEKELPRKLLAL